MSTSRVGLVNSSCASDRNGDPATISESAATNSMCRMGLICCSKVKTI
jgi:hypothetical protein